MAAISPLKLHYKRMAAYHKWANATLWRTVQKVSPEHYQKDVGLFFKSIHGTLSHIELVDRLWYGRMTQNPIKITGLDQCIYSPSEKELLRQAMVERADIWIAYIDSLTDEQLEEHFSYVDTKGVQQNRHRGTILSHVFNHGTHHRGQITAALTHLGYEAPEIDLLYMPAIDVAIK